LLNINMDDEGIGQQNYNRILAAQLALAPTNGPTIGVANSNIVSPEKYAQNGQDALAAGLAIGTVNGAMVMVAPSISLGNAVVASTVFNGANNAYSQFDKYGEIKYPAELAINTGFGALEGVLGRYSGLGWKGVGYEAIIGAGSNVYAATATNYQNDADHQYNMLWEATKGAGVGAGVKALEERKIVFKPLEPYWNVVRGLIWR